MSNSWDHEAFRNYILHAAVALGLDKQADIARATGVTPSLLSKWFRGLERPSTESLRKISDELHVPMAELLVLVGRATEDDLGV